MTTTTKPTRRGARVYMTQREGGWKVHESGVAGEFIRSTEKAAEAARALVESTGGALEIDLHPSVGNFDDTSPDEITEMFPGAVQLPTDFGKRFEWTPKMEATSREVS